MKKRTALLKVLKNRFTNFVDTEAFTVTLWIALIILCAITGFNVSKEDPIPLTENEIQYYTEQAELAYNKGLGYLDNNIMIIPIDSTTANIYPSDIPYGKQKLKVTYWNNEIVNAEPYYSDSFLGDRIIIAALSALFGSVFVALPISNLIAWFIRKIISIKKDVEEELENANSVTDEED